MFGVTTSDDYRPVTWMGHYPVDVTTILVGVHVISLRRSVARRMAVNAARVREDFGNLRKERTRSSLRVGDIGECRGSLEIVGTSSLRECARDTSDCNK